MVASSYDCSSYEHSANSEISVFSPLKFSDFSGNMLYNSLSPVTSERMDSTNARMFLGPCSRVIFVGPRLRRKPINPPKFVHNAIYVRAVKIIFLKTSSKEDVLNHCLTPVKVPIPGLNFNSGSGSSSGPKIFLCKFQFFKTNFEVLRHFKKFLQKSSFSSRPVPGTGPVLRIPGQFRFQFRANSGPSFGLKYFCYF